MLRSQDRQITLFQSFGSNLAIHRRYKERRFLCILYRYLHEITVRPVPCNYYVIRQDNALSRVPEEGAIQRRFGKSERGSPGGVCCLTGFEGSREGCVESFNQLAAERTPPFECLGVH